MNTILQRACCWIFFGAIMFYASKPYAKPINIFISKVVDHPALDATTRGIEDALKSAGYDSTKNMKFRIESAQANPVLAQQIASKFVNMNPTLVIGIGTVSAQSFIKYARQKKVSLVFSSITDPAGAGLSIKEPSNIYGVSNFVPLEPQLALFKKILPKLKTLGILYNPGEVNSVSMVTKLETLCPTLGLKLVKQTINKTADVTQSLIKILQNVDAIFISNDNTALSAMPLIIKVTEKAKIPVFVSDTDAVQTGALAAIGPNQYEVGQQTGRMVVRMLQGQTITAPIEFPGTTELFLNLEAARKLNIIIPPALLVQATRIYPAGTK